MSYPLPQQGRSIVETPNEEKDIEVQPNRRETQDEWDRIPVPWIVKWTSLVAVIALPIGVNWSNASLGPLRNTLRNQLEINNEQFGVISSADAIVNSIWPLIGGIMLDWRGVEFVTPICTVTILVGSLLTAIGCQAGNWRTLAGGYIIQGFGTALLDSCQQVYFHAFGRRQGLAFVFGLENAIASSISLAAEASAIPIRDNLGLQYVFWIAVAFCGFSVLVNGVYLFFAKRMMPEQFRVKSGKQTAAQKGAKPKLLSIEPFKLLPWCFWVLPMTQLLQSGAADGFSIARADMIRMKGYTEATAGFMQSGTTAIKIVLAPVLGWAVDRWGHRFHYVALAPLLWITSCALLGFSSAHPLVALVFASLAGVINGAPLQMALHLLVADHRLIGTAFGVWRAFNNSGSVIMDVSFGRIQDDTPNMGYDRVLYLTIGLKSLAFALGVGYILMDKYKLGGGLTMTRKQRDAIEEDFTPEVRAEHPLTKRYPIFKVTVAGFCLLVPMVVTAWVLFFLGLSE